MNRDIFAKVPRKLCERAGEKVKVHVEGGGPVNFAKKICPEKGFRDASCMFLKGYQEVIRDSLA